MLSFVHYSALCHMETAIRISPLIFVEVFSVEKMKLLAFFGGQYRFKNPNFEEHLQIAASDICSICALTFRGVLRTPSNIFDRAILSTCQLVSKAFKGTFALDKNHSGFKETMQ